MAKVYEKKLLPPSPAREVNQFVKTVCDLCGAESKRDDWWYFYGHRDPEDNGNLQETEVKVVIRYTHGTSYPEGGNGKEYSVDICPDCFRKKLIPWLKEQGAEIREEEWEF